MIYQFTKGGLLVGNYKNIHSAAKESGNKLDDIIKAIENGTISNDFYWSIENRIALSANNHSTSISPGFYLEDILPDVRNVLVIGDPHEPFTLDSYLPFCVEQYRRFQCNQVIFIGDIIDNHFSSYHESDPDGLSARDELKFAKTRIKKWHETFPGATVIIGNHDRLVYRKAHTAGVSKDWLRPYSEVLDCPTWAFKEELYQDNVLYVHGEGKKAELRAKAELISVVQGHHHSEFYTKWIVGKKSTIFAVQTGCGVDMKTYAMVYALKGPSPALGCAVILNNGTLPINCPMK